MHKRADETAEDKRGKSRHYARLCDQKYDRERRYNYEREENERAANLVFEEALLMKRRDSGDREDGEYGKRNRNEYRFFGISFESLTVKCGKPVLNSVALKAHHNYRKKDRNYSRAKKKGEELYFYNVQMILHL